VEVKAGFLLDVNVFIAMAWPTHRAHRKVQQWLSEHALDGWATCPLTQTAFVRILSNPAFSPNALTPGDAFALLRANLGHPAHVFWADEPSLLQAFEILPLRLIGHQQVTDAYLLGLSAHKKGKFVTMDRSIPELLDDKSRARDLIELV